MHKTGGNKYGTHRSIDPQGSLPQPAWKLDNSMEIWDNEILLDVETLNIDAASFRQISQQGEGDVQRIGEIIVETVKDRGKQHNPVTGSGGMLIGKVAELGSSIQSHPLAVGDRVATLVSLSLTPLQIEEVLAVHTSTSQVDVRGQAVLFESGIYAKLPQDMPDKLALAVLDVAGAPAQTAKIVAPGDRVLVIGAGGKSGLLCLHKARQGVGDSGTVVGLDYSAEALERIKSTGLADEIIQEDATSPVSLMNKVQDSGGLADVTINCVDIPGTEMSSILATKDGGTVYFFSMATSFTAAALGAEGVGKDVDMLIGNGYTRGHADIALNCLKESSVLKDIFSKLYS